MQPINYLPQPQNFLNDALGAYKLGMDFSQLQADQAAKQAIQQQQENTRRQISELMGKQNPSADDYVRVAALLPEKEAASMRANWETLSKERQNADLSFGGQVLAAFQSQQPQIGADLLRERAKAERNSGRENQAKAFETWAQLAEVNPAAAQKTIGVMLAGLPGGDKVVQAALTAAKAPAEVAKAEADARKGAAEATIFEANATPEMITARANEQLAKTNKEAVAAKFAESKAIQELKLGEAQIKALADDTAIKRQNVAIAAMNAQTARAGNDLKRQELQIKVDEMVKKRDDTVREKVATAESGAANIDNMLNTIERVKKNPALNAVVGPLEGSDYYPQTFVGMQLGTASSDDRADAIALIDTLGSQAFLAQIPNIKGMGALSNEEGKKLQAALQNLSRKQSEKQFRANLDEAARLLNIGRETLAKSTGVPLGKPDTPAAPGGKPPLSSFFKP